MADVEHGPEGDGLSYPGIRLDQEAQMNGQIVWKGYCLCGFVTEGSNDQDGAVDQLDAHTGMTTPHLT